MTAKSRRYITNFDGKIVTGRNLVCLCQHLTNEGGQQCGRKYCITDEDNEVYWQLWWDGVCWKRTYERGEMAIQGTRGMVKMCHGQPVKV